jgi:hypothetical protein
LENGIIHAILRYHFILNSSSDGEKKKIMPGEGFLDYNDINKIAIKDKFPIKKY